MSSIIGSACAQVSKRFGEEGLPKDTIKIALTGHAGQSLGAWLASGISISLVGDANDYVGKGLSGGTIAITAPPECPFDPFEQVRLCCQIMHFKN